MLGEVKLDVTAFGASQSGDVFFETQFRCFICFEADVVQGALLIHLAALSFRKTTFRAGIYSHRSPVQKTRKPLEGQARFRSPFKIVAPVFGNSIGASSPRQNSFRNPD